VQSNPKYSRTHASIQRDHHSRRWRLKRGLPGAESYVAQTRVRAPSPALTPFSPRISGARRCTTHRLSSALPRDPFHTHRRNSIRRPCKGKAAPEKWEPSCQRRQRWLGGRASSHAQPGPVFAMEFPTDVFATSASFQPSAHTTPPISDVRRTPPNDRTGRVSFESHDSLPLGHGPNPGDCLRRSYSPWTTAGSARVCARARTSPLQEMSRSAGARTKIGMAFETRRLRRAPCTNTKATQNRNLTTRALPSDGPRCSATRHRECGDPRTSPAPSGPFQQTAQHRTAVFCCARSQFGASNPCFTPPFGAPDPLPASGRGTVSQDDSSHTMAPSSMLVHEDLIAPQVLQPPPTFAVCSNASLPAPRDDLRPRPTSYLRGVDNDAEGAIRLGQLLLLQTAGPAGAGSRDAFSTAQRGSSGLHYVPARCLSAMLRADFRGGRAARLAAVAS